MVSASGVGTKGVLAVSIEICFRFGESKRTDVGICAFGFVGAEGGGTTMARVARAAVGGTI